MDFVALRPAPLFDYSTQTLFEVQQIDAKLKKDQVLFTINKIFIHLSSTDLLIALHVEALLNTG